MKKTLLTAFVVLTVVGGALAFKSHNVRSGGLFCQATSGMCTDQVTKYALGGTTSRYCNSTIPGDVQCINHVKAFINP